MTFKTFKPSPLLSPYIHFYWIFEHDSRHIINSQRIVPTGCVEMMIQYGDILKKQKNNDISIQPTAILTGQMTGFYDIIQTGKTAFLSILFKPHAPRMFFDLPINEFLNQSIDLAMIIKEQADQITEKIVRATSHEAKITVIESFLLNRLSEKHMYNFERLSKCVNLVNTNFADVKVHQLATITCLSEKQFYRVFKDYVGLSPKSFLKIVRLQASFYHMQKLKTKSLTELAYMCGFFDQAHFINDFKKTTGLTPMSYFKNDGVVSDYFI